MNASFESRETAFEDRHSGPRCRAD
jgi:hypothetical protein